MERYRELHSLRRQHRLRSRADAAAVREGKDGSVFESVVELELHKKGNYSFLRVRRRYAHDSVDSYSDEKRYCNLLLETYEWQPFSVPR